MTRKEVRANAMKLLYAYSLREDNLPALYDIAEDDADAEILVDDAVRQLADGTVSHMEEIDAVIGRLSPKRSISRIPKLCLAVIRLAMYEMRWDDGTPVNAAVSEAIRLAEEYTPVPEDIRFINGLLGAYSRELAAEAESAS